MPVCHKPLTHIPGEITNEQGSGVLEEEQCVVFDQSENVKL
jgi:hypothetical protein